MHRITKFNQNAWEKTTENVRKHRDIKLLITDTRGNVRGWLLF